MKRLFLIDAYALVFKYYYAFMGRPMRNRHGMNTSILFGFTKFLRDIQKREKPDLLGVALDPKGGSFRCQLFPEYKANRPETPEDIIASVPYLCRLLRAMRIPVFEIAGYEADDVIGTLAVKGEQAGYEVFMVTPDKDYGQLVGDHRHLYKQKGDGGGFYWPISAEETVIADHPFDVILKLQAKTGRFTQNKKYEVYQGPGEDYGRSGGGKGTVSTNGPIRCFGTWRGWLLIEYEINADKHRYGWIRLDDLPQKQRDDYAPFAFSNGYGEFNYGVLIAGAALTDDPFYSRNVVAQAPAGTSVRVLAKTEDYLLVNGFVGRKMYMGFVHESYVDMKFGYAENAVCSIDEAKAYSHEDILAAAEAVKDAVRKWFSGTSVVEIKYIEAESADATDWWQPEAEHREGMQLFADLNGMSFYDYEIASYGVAKDYGFILYRDKNGGEWEVCNWGYE